jgi:hypothetical protein
VEYFKASGLFWPGRLSGILDPGEVLQGQWPVWGMSPYWDLYPFIRLLSCGNCISTTEILNFDKYLFLFHMSLGYKTWGLITTFKVKLSLGKKPEKEKEYPLQK